MRKGFDTLAALAEQVTGQDPLSGHLFVFRNRRGDKLKLLMWDRDGYVLIYKRLEQGQFKLPGINEPTASAIRRGATRPVGRRTNPYQKPICGLLAKNFSTS
jgi:transposase